MGCDDEYGWVVWEATGRILFGVAAAAADSSTETERLVLRRADSRYSSSMIFTQAMQLGATGVDGEDKRGDCG